MGPRGDGAWGKTRDAEWRQAQQVNLHEEAGELRIQTKNNRELAPAADCSVLLNDAAHDDDGKRKRMPLGIAPDRLQPDPDLATPQFSCSDSLSAQFHQLPI